MSLLVMLRACFRNVGFHPKRLLGVWSGWRRYAKDRREFRAMPGAGEIPWGDELPILTEWDEQAGSLGPYFQQDLTVARWVYEADPKRHVDIGSRIDGFVSHLAVFREVEVLDIRELSEPAYQIRFSQLDLMTDLPDVWVESTDSLSCLHTIEHFGLGRYGDRLDPRGYHRGVQQLQRMVQPGGVMYLSTPVGPERLEFNAHRVFSLATVLSWFEEGWTVEKLAVVDDDNQVLEGLSPGANEVEDNFGCRCGVGMIAARKTG